MKKDALLYEKNVSKRENNFPKKNASIKDTAKPQKRQHITLQKSKEMCPCLLCTWESVV